MSYVWPLVLIVGALILRAGLTMYSVGLVRSKNASSAMGRHLLDWSIAVLAYWVIGSAFAAQTNSPVIGFNAKFMFGVNWDNGKSMAGLLAGMGYVFVVGSIFVGATVARARIGPIMALSVLSAGFIVPICVNWSTFGWLQRIGYIDTGGASWIHVTGAMIALAAVRAVGPRDGKYHRDESASMIPGHNLTLTLAGAFLVVPGALFMLGSTGPYGVWTARLIVNILLSATASTAAAALYCHVRFSKIDLPILAAAMIGGVVAISALPGETLGYAPAVIGAVAGLLVTISIIKLDLVARIDDVTGAVAIHGVAGVWGVVATAMFSHAFNSDDFNWPLHFKQILVQLTGVVSIGAFAFIVTTVALKLISNMSPLRVSEQDEFDGLDLAEHDVASYPDFQQITIKSHHLREA